MILFILVVLFALFHLFIACKVAFNKQKNNAEIKQITSYKEMSILIPCYNEAVILKGSIRSLLKQSYPGLEIIFINDGSEDDTMVILKKELGLVPIVNSKQYLETKSIIQTYSSTKYKNIFVIDKQNGGKADSLNAGINFANKEYVVTLDADSILKEDALYEINGSLQDEDIIALGGNVMVSQGVSNYTGKTIYAKLAGSMLERAQSLEYLRGFFVLKNSSAHLDALSVISGAFGVFNRQVMLELEGFEETIGEDMDITIRCHKYAKEHDKKITYNDRAVCFTEVPNNWGDVCRQRVRWQKAFLDALKNHAPFLIKNMFKSKLSFFMLIESTLLMYTAILVTIVGGIYLGAMLLSSEGLNSRVYYLALVGVVLFVLYNVVTFKIAERIGISFKRIGLLNLLGILIYEFLWYRPLMIGIILYGSIAYFINPSGWNKVKRIGVNDTMVIEAEEEERIA